MTLQSACMSTPRSVLREIYAREGLRAAVIHLNHQTTHRFTAVLRFGNAMLSSICFYDRENPAALSCPDIPEHASYCVFVKRSRAPLVIGNAPLDPRTEGHPARHEVLAYCGFPLTDESGRAYGTMCHFDVEPRPRDHAPIELMEVMAELLRPDQKGAKALSAVPDGSRGWS